MQIQAPVRPNDFVNSNIEAPLRCVEELSAVDRIPLANITPFLWGFTLRLNSSNRLEKWWADQTQVRRLFLLEAAERGPFSTTVLVSRGLGESPSANKYAAVCPWTALSEAAQELRSTHIGPDFLTRRASNKDEVPAIYTGEILGALKFAEIPLNGSDLSGYCRLKWGTLLRVGPLDVDRVVDYLAIAKPANSGELVTINLGANMVAIAAFSPRPTEPLRVGICWRWWDDQALKDVSRWLRKLSISSQAQPNLEPG